MKAGWEYIDSTTDPREPQFQIRPNVSKAFPQSLFKYFSVNEDSCDALMKGYIYAPDRWELNDPFDCHPNLIDFSSLTEHQKMIFRKTYKMDSIKRCLMLYERHFFMRYGIVSMTADGNHILMWAHYARNSGFVVEYDYARFNKKSLIGPFPVQYLKEFARVSTLDGRKNEINLYVTNVKNEVWQYEDEWRFLAFNPEGMRRSGDDSEENKKLPERKFYCPDSIKSVTLGPRFFDVLSEMSPKLESREITISLSGLKLRMISHLLLNKIELNWVRHPDYIHDNRYGLTKRKMILEQIDEHQFRFVNHTDFN